MKKRIIKVVAVILVVALVCGGTFGGYILYRFNFNGPKDLVHSYEEVYNQKPVTYDVGGDGEFSVLKIFHK